MALFGSPKAIRYYILHKVKGKYQVLFTGKVDPTKEHFNFKGHIYHVDVSRVIEDESGHKSLQYELGIFQPLVEVVPGVLDNKDLELEATGSQDSYLALDRGIVKGVLSAVHVGSNVGLIMIVAIAALCGAAGYFAGNTFPISPVRATGQASVTTSINGTVQTVLSEAKGSTVTLTSQLLVTIPEYLPPETTTTTQVSPSTQTVSTFYATPTFVTVTTTSTASSTGSTTTTITTTTTSGGVATTTTTTHTTIVTFNQYQTTTTTTRTQNMTVTH